MKIAVVVWNEDTRRPGLRDIQEDALGIEFQIDHLPGEVFKIEEVKRSTRFPDGALKIRSVHRILTVIPEAPNAITLVLRND